MSDLHLALIALGAVLVAAVVGYNAWQERRARRRAEAAFRGGHADALLSPVAARREPVMGVLPADPDAAPVAAPGRAPEAVPVTPPEAVPVTPPEAVPESTYATPVPDERLAAAPEDDQAPKSRPSPSAVISHRVDTIAIVLADQPVVRAELEPLEDALAIFANPVHVEALVNEQWVPVVDSPRDGWRELRVGLQLASRAGPIAEADIATFEEMVAAFAASIDAVSQRETPAAAAARARDLDRFCADVDVEVAVNLVGRAGTTFAISRVSAFALEMGFADMGGGHFARRGAHSAGTLALRLHEREAKRDLSYATGLTFAFDIPLASDPVAALGEMVAMSRAFGDALGGDLVDDERRPLGESGLAAIERSLQAVVQRMQAHGIPAGGALARRLFA